MARVHAKNLNLSYNAVALEGWMREATIAFTVPEAGITSFADAGENALAGKKDCKVDIAGPLDMVASGVDATLFGGMGSGVKSTVIDLTGAGPGADDPQYKCTASGLTGALIASYALDFPAGGAATYTATIQHSGSTTRAVA